MSVKRVFISLSNDLLFCVSVTQSDTESENGGFDGEGDNDNPYPLEGKYIDEADRTR